MAIGSTQGSTAVPPNPTTDQSPQNPTSSLGKADFMKLLVAQLKNQDPLNPMDSKEMITQLSTLTSVEKLTSVDTSLTQLRAETTGMAGMQATSLIGRKVTAEANHVVVPQAGTATASFSLNGNAADVQVTVRDKNGNALKVLDLGKQGPGPHTFVWDATNADNQRVATGSYSFEVAAKSDAGQPVPTSTQVTGAVSEVSFKNGAAELTIGTTQVALGDVVSILP